MVDAAADAGPVPPIVAGADRAWLLRVPHWLVIALFAAAGSWLRAGRAGAAAPVRAAG